MRSSITILFVSVLVLSTIVPLAQADWMHRGTSEPDTAYDVVGGMMWNDPDTDPSQEVNKVYFNGLRTLQFTSYNPNVAATGSRVQAFGETGFTIMLGYWKDCNGDGYVGMSEYGLQEYRSELLLNDDLCPSATPEKCVPPGCPTGYMYPHNDGSWIRELIWIGDRAGNGGGPIGANPTYFAAKDTAVWGTFGRPDEAPATVCPLTGGISIRSTGAIIQHADCLTGFQGVQTLNAIQDETGLPTGGWDPANIDESPAPLNIGNPAHAALFGPDGKGHGGGVLSRDNSTSGDKPERTYSFFDCNGGGTEVDDPTGGALSGSHGVEAPTQEDPTTGENAVPSQLVDRNGNLVTTVSVFDSNGKRTVPTVAPSVGSPSGSFYEGANETYQIATTGECYPSNHDTLYPSLEGDTQSTSAIRGRDRADLDFIFGAGARQKTAGAPGDVTGPNWPADLGLGPNRDLDTVGSAWRENRAFVTLPQLVNRADLTLASAQYMTFYVALGQTAFDSGLETPANGNAFVFGAEACGFEIGPGAPNRGGWQCDPQAWIDACNEEGRSAPGCLSSIVGSPYHMRDIDCEDGALVRDVPVYASPAALTTACLGPNDAI